MMKFYNMTPEERSKMGEEGRQHVLDNYGLGQYAALWYETFNKVFDKFGSWENRKNYKKWELTEIK